jgi:CRP-like cAMP-binding protein
MAQQEYEIEPEADRESLSKLERVSTGAALTDKIFSLVGRSQFFAEFSREDISILSGYMDVYRAQPGGLIIREGDSGDFMLLVIEGAVDILKRGIRGEQHMTSAGAGTTLGEMSMIDGEPRFASCLATQTTLFAVLTRDAMAQIILDQASLGSKILVKLVTMLSLRLRQTSVRLLKYMEGSR